MVIFSKIISKIFFGLIFFFLIFLFLAQVEQSGPEREDRFQSYIKTIDSSDYSDGLGQLAISEEREQGILHQYIMWLGEMVTARNGWGLDRDRVRRIHSEIKRVMPFTVILVFMTVFIIILVSLVLSYLLTGTMSNRMKGSIETVSEFISSIPEFIFCFVLLRPFPIYLTMEYTDLFVRAPEGLREFLTITGFMILPAIALSFANGSVSTLTKYLVNRMTAIRKSQFYIFLEANGTKRLYLNYIIMLKEVLPLIVRFIIMKLPLIIGSSIVIERIFNIEGLSNKAFQTFRGPDYGFVLSILFIIYIVTSLSDVFAESVNTFTNPERKKLC